MASACEPFVILEDAMLSKVEVMKTITDQFHGVYTYEGEKFFN